MTTTADVTASQREIYSVSRLNSAVHAVLAQHFPLVWVEGELTNFSRPSSGHWYFTLKDSQAQVRCAMFKGLNRFVDFKPEAGMQVLVRARLSLYEPRGDYQLVIESMEAAGSGALQRAFEELKNRLQKEGLFAATHKHALPSLPKAIGVITSPSGAAIRDICQVLRRRFPAVPVIVYPCTVQGNGAAKEICAALETAQRHGVCDVLILARGGGSLEDLWPFNEEIVARTLFRCRVPVVTGIGHEVDFTIADFVADQRAPTPSAAAELVVPDQAQWLANLEQKLQRLERILSHQVKSRRLRLAATRKALIHPRSRLLQQSQRLDELEQRRLQAWANLARNRRHRIDSLQRQLWMQSPAHTLDYLGKDLQRLHTRLHRSVNRALESHQQHLLKTSQALHTVSPLATLDRGYAIVIRAEDKKVLRQADDITVGHNVEARLARGRLVCTVAEKYDE